MKRLQKVKYKKSVMQSDELDSEIPRESPRIFRNPLSSCYLNRNPERKKEKRDRRDRSIRSRIYLMHQSGPVTVLTFIRMM